MSLFTDQHGDKLVIGTTVCMHRNSTMYEVVGFTLGGRVILGERRRFEEPSMNSWVVKLSGYFIVKPQTIFNSWRKC